MAARYDCSDSSSSLLPHFPNLPPEFPDLYGKRREMAEIQVLERESGYVELLFGMGHPNPNASKLPLLQSGRFCTLKCTFRAPRWWARIPNCLSCALPEDLQSRPTPTDCLSSALPEPLGRKPNWCYFSCPEYQCCKSTSFGRPFLLSPVLQ